MHFKCIVHKCIAQNEYCAVSGSEDLGAEKLMSGDRNMSFVRGTHRFCASTVE